MSIMDYMPRCSVPDRWKSCTSPVGAVQSYIAELEASNAELLEALQEIVRNDPYNQSSAGIIARAVINKTEQIPA